MNDSRLSLGFLTSLNAVYRRLYRRLEQSASYRPVFEQQIHNSFGFNAGSIYISCQVAVLHEHRHSCKVMASNSKHSNPDSLAKAAPRAFGAIPTGLSYIVFMTLGACCSDAVLGSSGKL